MRLHQREMALLVSDESLLYIAIAIKISDEKYESFFVRDKYSHLTIYLRLMEHQCEMIFKEKLLSRQLKPIFHLA